MRYDLSETNYCSITHISVGADVNLIMQSTQAKNQDKLSIQWLLTDTKRPTLKLICFSPIRPTESVVYMGVLHAALPILEINEVIINSRRPAQLAALEKSSITKAIHRNPSASRP